MLPPLRRVAWGRRLDSARARAAVARCCVGLDGHHRARNASLPRRDDILGKPREIAWPRAVGDSRCWSYVSTDRPRIGDVLNQKAGAHIFGFFDVGSLGRR